MIGHAVEGELQHPLFPLRSRPRWAPRLPVHDLDAAPAIVATINGIELADDDASGTVGLGQGEVDLGFDLEGLQRPPFRPLEVRAKSLEVRGVFGGCLGVGRIVVTLPQRVIG